MTAPYQPQTWVDIASFTPSSSSASYLDSLIDESLLYYPSYAGGLDFQTADSSFMNEFDQGLGLNNFPNIYQPALRYPRLFWPKETPHRELSLNRKYVLGNLRNYPRMMLSASRDGMPPFVHSYHLSQDCCDDTPLPNPLARCAGIVAMWSVKTKYNSVHIWKAIRSEQERLLHEVFPTLPRRCRKGGSKLFIFLQHSEYNDWDTVAALQAMSIYVILRVLEKDEDVTDFDMPLIHTTLVRLPYAALHS